MEASSAYIDSNVFIHPVLYGDSELGRAAGNVLRQIEAGMLTAYTSALTWDEVVWVVLKTMGRADSVEVGRKLLSFPNLRFVPATEELLLRAQKITEEHDVAPRDAIHCASAVSRGIRVIVSEDAELDRFPGVKRRPPGSFRTRK